MWAAQGSAWFEISDPVLRHTHVWKSRYMRRLSRASMRILVMLGFCSPRATGHYRISGSRMGTPTEQLRREEEGI
ncbi:hypothetical protein FIBSPDRAFT_855065, partial [Athelia psychrophila]